MTASTSRLSRLRPRRGAHATQVARIGAGGLALLFAFTTLYVAAFHAPRAKGLDVGVVGSRAQAAQLQSALDLRARGAFDVRRYDFVSQARAALLHTDVQGVVVPGDRVLVAGALGLTPTQTVANALRGVARTPVVEDVRTRRAGDRRGLSSLFTLVGTLIPSLVFGVLLPPGAALSAVRDVEYFHWAATLAPLLVLGAWAAGGLAFGLLGDLYGPHVRKPATLRHVPAAA